MLIKDNLYRTNTGRKKNAAFFYLYIRTLFFLLIFFSWFFAAGDEAAIVIGRQELQTFFQQAETLFHRFEYFGRCVGTARKAVKLGHTAVVETGVQT